MPNVPDPTRMNTKSTEAAAAAIAVVKQNAGAPAPGRLIHNSYQNEVVKGNQYDSSAWKRSPASLQLLAMAVKRLARVSAMRGKPVKRVKHVRAAAIEGDTRAFIYPTDKTDPEAIPVIYNKSAAWINLITLLGPIGLTLEPGYRERYAVQIAGPDSPVGPALVMDFSLKLDRRTERKRNKALGAPGATGASASNT